MAAHGRHTFSEATLQRLQALSNKGKLSLILHGRDHAYLENPAYRLKLGLVAVGPEQGAAYLTLRTTSWEFAGERTDLHDVLSLFIAASVAGHGVSSRLVDELNPAIPELGE